MKKGSVTSPGWNKRRSRQRERDRAREAALIRMNVDRDVLEQSTVGLTDILNKAEGGIPAVLQAMRFSTDPTIGEFLGKYDAAGVRDRRIVPFEAFAIQAGVDIRQLLGAIILALRDHSATEVKITALTSHAAVTKATVENALKPSGYRDRQMIH